MKLLRGLLICSILICAVSYPGTVRANDGKYSDELKESFISSAVGEKVSMIVYLTDQVDILALDGMLYDMRLTRQERHRIVVEELQAAAERSQPAVRGELELLIEQGEVEAYTPYWIVNCFVVFGTESAAEILSELDEVDYFEPNFRAELIKPIIGPERALDDDEDTPPPGIVAIRAPEVWYELGIMGEGALVAHLDTGVDGGHPALSERWRGNFAPHSECWYATVSGSSTPVDTDTHGTHVMGTICGATNGGTGDTTGVAPSALWIGGDAIGQGTTSTFDNDVLSSYQWFADPDGNPETVNDVPDVVQNSWGVYSAFTGYDDCDDRWDAAILALEAGGTVVTFSAGNEGPSSQSHRSPANAIYDSVSFFSVGAVNTGSGDFPYPIADFSSRGPSDCDGSTIKPEVCAPGVNIYSSVPGGGYDGTYDGTSMAGPHVAGIVGLMRSANPDVEVREIKSIIMRTARDEGTTGEDNTYGHGFVDAYEAVLQVIQGYGRIQGYVRNATTLDPVPAQIEVVGGAQVTKASASTGWYQLILPGDSTYTLRYSLYGYVEDEAVVSTVADDTTFQDMNLVPRPVITLLTEDFESGAPDWTHEAASGWGDNWHLSTEQYYSGATSYKCGDTGTGDYDNLLDARLIFPVIPALPGEARLYFQMKLEGETSGAYPDSAYDGGIVEVAAEGGSFEEVTPVSRYSHVFRYESGSGNPASGPMLGLPCFADNPDWEQITVDLTEFEGQDVQIRFRFGSDAGVANEGWYVDDVVVSALGSAELVEPEGLTVFVDNEDVVLRWSADSNPAYRIYSDTDSEGLFETFEGETPETTLTIEGGAAVDLMKFYIVKGWNGVP